jgi:hypothetical protein
MSTKKEHTIKIDFGRELEMTFTLNDWEMKRFTELQNSGVPQQQAIGQVKSELKRMGFDDTQPLHIH